MRRDRWNTPESCCEGKAKHTSTQARRIADQMRRKDRGRVQPYHCGVCGAWHVGNKSGHIEDKRRNVEKRNDAGGDDVRP